MPDPSVLTCFLSLAALDSTLTTKPQYDDWTRIFRTPKPHKTVFKVEDAGSAVYQGGFMSLGPAVTNPSVRMKPHFLKLISQQQKWHMADQGFMNFLFGELLPDWTFVSNKFDQLKHAYGVASPAW